MGVVPQDKSIGDELSAVEANLLRDAGFIVDKNAGATINGATLPVPVLMDDTANEWLASDANVAARKKVHGFAITNSTDGNPIVVQITGKVPGFSSLDIGKIYYVQDTVGTIGTSAGTTAVIAGVAVSATEILILGNGDFVTLVGNQTVNGIKTLGSIPLLPGSNPTTDNQAARKAYVDSLAPKYDSGGNARAIADGVGQQEISHGMGRTPKMIVIWAATFDFNNNDVISWSHGVATALNTGDVLNVKDGLASIQMTRSTALIVHLGNQNNGDLVRADISAWDTDSFEIDWLEFDLNTGETVEFIWYAFS